MYLPALTKTLGGQTRQCANWQQHLYPSVHAQFPYRMKVNLKMIKLVEF